MSNSSAISPQIFIKDTLHNGRPVTMRYTTIADQSYEIRPGLLDVLVLEDEWYGDVTDPHAVERIARSAKAADLFTFCQRIPDIDPRYPFHLEWEDVAVLPIMSYGDWWTGIKAKVRSDIRRSEKRGLVVRRAAFDDAFVQGMTRIFNESPVRQGRRFWHYGKDFETVKRQFSRFVSREQMIGAYYEDEMIGFIMLGNAGRYGVIEQIISSLRHRDKAPNCAMMAKAVEVCDQEGLAHLAYGFWKDDTLTQFKHRCGFERVRVPRYFVPLTWKGRLALRCGLHRGLKARLPASIKQPLKRARTRWLELRTNEGV